MSAAVTRSAARPPVIETLELGDLGDLGRGGGIDTTGYERMYLMVFNPLYDNDVDSCSYNDYQIEVLTGKGTTNPVIATLNRTYFEPLS